MDKSDALDVVRDVARKIERLDRRRARLVSERNDALVNAKASGATWGELCGAALLSSPNALRKALDSVK